MSLRLIMAIFSTLLEEAALVVVVLWGLPQAGVVIPPAGLIALMVAWVGFSAFIYRTGSRALRKPVTDLPIPMGSKCRVIRRLAPDGMVGIKGEMWAATSIQGDVGAGEEVFVLGSDGLRLIVSPKRPGEED